MTSPNIFDSIPDNLDKEVFDDIISGENIKIERIVSMGHVSPEKGWYEQSENEWVIVLKGEAKLLLENEGEVHLVAGNHINIPAHKRHKVTWTPRNTKTIWLAVHY